MTDSERGVVVVVVRGTLSLEDCVTDAMCDAVEVSNYFMYCIFEVSIVD